MCRTLLLFFALWQPKIANLCVMKLSQTVVPLTLPFFFMDHMVNYLRNLKLVRLGAVNVQDDFLLGQMLLSNRLPLSFSDRSRSWSSPLCHGFKLKSFKDSGRFQQARPIAPISRGDCLQSASLLSPSLWHLPLHQSNFAKWGHHR